MLGFRARVFLTAVSLFCRWFRRRYGRCYGKPSLRCSRWPCGLHFVSINTKMGEYRCHIHVSIFLIKWNYGIISATNTWEKMTSERLWLCDCRIKGYSPDMSQCQIRNTFKRAFRVWEEVTDLTFSMVDRDDADIIIYFGFGRLDCASPWHTHLIEQCSMSMCYCLVASSRK